MNKHHLHHSKLVSSRSTMAKQQEPDTDALKYLDKKISAASDLINPRVAHKKSSIAKRAENERLAYV